MNKQELIDKAVEVLKGEPMHDNDLNVYVTPYDDFVTLRAGYRPALGGKFVCTIPEFKARASELGWINGYKYGVEYPTNGKKPDLPDGTVVELYTWCDDGPIWMLPIEIQHITKWDGIESFVVVDCRYRPKAEQIDNSWHTRGELPPVDVECEVFNSALDNTEWEKCVIHFMGKITCVYTSESCTERCAYLDFVKFRPLKTEREKFVDAVRALAREKQCEIPLSFCASLYDAGFRAPEDK